MKHSRIAVYVDLLVCLVIMPLIITLVPVDKWIVHNTTFLAALVTYVYGLYFIYRRTKPSRLFMQHRYITVAVILLLLIGMTELLTHFPMSESDSVSDPRQLAARRNMRTQTVWFFFLVVTGFSLVIELTFELFRQTIAGQELAAQKDRAELALYKAQINPHFLFNTLNTLYAMTLSKSEQTESAFMKFSNILRYMYTNADKETILLKDEVEYLRQYIDLQRLRLNGHTRIVFEEDIDNDAIPVPPMLFIVFVENAFKYGISSEKDCTVRISIRLKGYSLDFSTCNMVMRQPEDGIPGIGIGNCRKRLQLLFPDRFTLETSEHSDIFTARLTIQLK